ncbi:hypothetical protein MASR2M8_00220 [Opitutaceae bacterium]
MKAWTLIAFYLWKDIWSRWVETPGAFLARLLVAVLLAGIMLLVQAAFGLAGRSLESRIERMGARTLVIGESMAGETGVATTLGTLLAPLQGKADVVALRQAPVGARDEFGTDLTVLAYGPESLALLAPALASARDAGVHLASPTLPPGLPVRVEIDGADHAAVTIARPAWLDRIASQRPVLLLPSETASPWLEHGYYEYALVLSDDTTPGAITRLAHALRTLLFVELRNAAHLQSPESLLSELDGLRTLQLRAQALTGFVGGAVVALLFGSIAVLEYRQNRYIVALLRSFGTPSTLLLARYAIESLLIVTGALLLARAGLTGLHGTIFSLAGFEAGLLDARMYDPYTWSQVWTQARWLGVGAALAIAPIALALRLPVGRVLS